MKRFLRFSMNDYSGGGWDEFDGDWDTLEAAEQDLIHCREKDWSHIVDTETKEIVAYYDFSKSEIDPVTHRRLPGWDSAAYKVEGRWIKCKAIRPGDPDNWEWEEIVSQ